nr:MAG TPA: hypothetical protein [Caudoviricetes sp.]
MIRDVILKRIESFQKLTYSNVSIQRNVRKYERFQIGVLFKCRIY